MCLLTTMILLVPRALGATWWILNPELWRGAFSSRLWPVVGLMFLPWVTMAYVWVSPDGIKGLEWLLIGLGAVVDIASYGGGGYANRERIPRTTSSANMAKR